MKIVNLSIAIIAIALCTGCASILSGTKQDIYIHTEPQGADIYMNGMKESVSSGEIRVSKNYSKKNISIKKEGYEDFNFVLIREFDPVAVLDLLGLYGFVIDGATGAILKYEKSYYDIELQPIAKTIRAQDESVTQTKMVSTEKADNSTEDIAVVEDVQEIKVERKGEVFFIVEDMPEFPGGQDALVAFISDNIKYPVDAQKNGVEGRVYVSFIIDQSGEVSDVKIARGVHPDLDNEGMRVVALMPNWKPGIQRGKKVKVSYTMPINFSLENSTKRN